MPDVYVILYYPCNCLLLNCIFLVRSVATVLIWVERFTGMALITFVVINCSTFYQVIAAIANMPDNPNLRQDSIALTHVMCWIFEFSNGLNTSLHSPVYTSVPFLIQQMTPVFVVTSVKSFASGGYRISDISFIGTFGSGSVT